MSRVCRLALGLAWLVATGGGWADDAISQPECSSGVCVFNVVARELVSAPCAGYAVLIAYSTSSGATMIQCSKPADSEENKSFLYDRLNPRAKAIEFLGGRFVRPDFWNRVEAEGVPDKFGSVPLCPSQTRTPPAIGELVIVKKQIRDSGDGYCYRVNYVDASKSGLTIRNDQGRENSPLSDAAALKWAKLKARLSQHIAK